MVKPLYFIVPGDLNQLTGGYLYNRHMIEGLRQRQWQVVVHELAGSFPHPDQAAYEAVRQAVAHIPSGALVVIDGLALPAFRQILPEQGQRLRLIALSHLPLAAETGLSVVEQQRLAQIEYTTLTYMDRIIVTGRQTAQEYATYGIEPDRMGLVRPGTTAVSFERQPAANREGPLRLLCVATVTPRKGHEILIDALATLTDLAWRLCCIGSLHRSPGTVTAVRARIRQHQLTERVILMDEKLPGEVAEAYKQADVFVLASYYESYGMVLSEAMAYGLPIISTTGGAIPTTVAAAAGLLVPPGDTAALAAALRAVISDEALRARLAHGAHQARANLLDWAEAVTCFETELGLVRGA